MHFLALVLAAAAAAQSPSAALDAARVQLEAQGWTVAPLSQADVQAAPTPPSAPASVVPAELWASLPVPAPEFLAWLVQREPGLDPSAVRQLTPEGAEAIFSAAAARGLSPIDLFTDPGFRGRDVFFIPNAVVEGIFARYELPVLTLASGQDADGRPYRMDALLAGAGRVDALYDRAFTAGNGYFPGYTYNLDARVAQTIDGPGSMSVGGVTVNAFVRVTLKRMVKSAPSELTIEIDTPFGRQRQTKPVRPIRRR